MNLLKKLNQFYNLIMINNITQKYENWNPNMIFFNIFEIYQGISDRRREFWSISQDLFSSRFNPEIVMSELTQTWSSTPWHNMLKKYVQMKLLCYGSKLPLINEQKIPNWLHSDRYIQGFQPNPTYPILYEIDSKLPFIGLRNNNE